jgi:hypothetical protein
MDSFTKKVIGYVPSLDPGDSDIYGVILIICEDDNWLNLVFQKHPIFDCNVNTFESDSAGSNSNGYAVAVIDGCDQYPYYIDLLRNEGPLSVYFWLSETPPRFQIYTSELEGVGEGEIVGTLDQIRDILNR